MCNYFLILGFYEYLVSQLTSFESAGTFEFPTCLSISIPNYLTRPNDLGYSITCVFSMFLIAFGRRSGHTLFSTIYVLVFNC